MTALPVFAPRRLGHVNIFVSDVHRACRFYSSVCGVDQVYFEDDIQMGFMSNGRSNHDLGLMQTMNKPRIGRDGYVQPSTGRGAVASLNHLAFELESQRALVDAYRRAVANSVKISTTSDHGVARSIYLHDPDGHMVEFYADAVEDWRTFYRKGANALITGAWDPLATAAPDTPFYETDFVPATVAGALFHPIGIHGAGLYVADLERSARFYESVGGMRRGTQNETSVSLVGSTGLPTLTLVQRSAHGNGGALHHMSFELRDGPDLATMDSRLVEHGARPAGALEHAGGRSVFFRDADGFLIEMFHGRYGYAAAGMVGSHDLPVALQ